MKRFALPILAALACILSFSSCDSEPKCTVLTYVSPSASGSHSVPTDGVSKIYTKYIAAAQNGFVADDVEHIVSGHGSCDGAIPRAQEAAIAGSEKAQKEVLLSTYQDCSFAAVTADDKWNLRIVVRVETTKTVEHFYQLVQQ